MILSELYILAIVVATCFIQKWIFKHNKPFKHWPWIIILLVAFVPVWFFTKNLVALAAGVLLKVVVFDPFLNLIRGHKFWYTNTSDPNGSQIDKAEGPVWKKILYFASLIGLITLNIVYYVKNI